MGVALKKRSRRSTISLSSSHSSSSSPSSSISCSSSLESNSFMKSILFTRRMALILAAASFLSLATFLYASRLSTSPSLFYSFEIVKELPHDETAFTQGLLYGGNDTFYESTGFYGKSSVRRVHLQTGKVLDIHHMDRSYFGEGLTLSGERILQFLKLWMKDSVSLNKLSTFHIE